MIYSIDEINCRCGPIKGLECDPQYNGAFDKEFGCKDRKDDWGNDDWKNEWETEMPVEEANWPEMWEDDVWDKNEDWRGDDMWYDGKDDEDWAVTDPMYYYYDMMVMGASVAKATAFVTASVVAVATS